MARRRRTPGSSRRPSPPLVASTPPSSGPPPLRLHATGRGALTEVGRAERCRVRAASTSPSPFTVLARSTPPWASQVSTTTPISRHIVRESSSHHCSVRIGGGRRPSQRTLRKRLNVGRTSLPKVQGHNWAKAVRDRTTASDVDLRSEDPGCEQPLPPKQKPQGSLDAGFALLVRSSRWRANSRAFRLRWPAIGSPRGGSGFARWH